MPWHQIHAWRVFVKFTECYCEYKKDTLIAVVISVLMQLPEKVSASGERSEGKMQDEICEVTFDKLEKVLKEDDGSLCDDALTRFLKVLYSITIHDQECFVAVFSLFANPKKDANWVRKTIGGISALVSKMDIKATQENLVKVSKCMLEKIIKLACVNNERDVAYECVMLQQMIKDLGSARIHSLNSNTIASKIDQIESQLKKVGAMLRVMIEMKKVNSEVKLLGYYKSGEAQ